MIPGQENQEQIKSRPCRIFVYVRVPSKQFIAIFHREAAPVPLQKPNDQRHPK